MKRAVFIFARKGKSLFFEFRYVFDKSIACVAGVKGGRGNLSAREREGACEGE